MRISGTAITEGNKIVRLVIQIEGGPDQPAFSPKTPVMVDLSGKIASGVLVVGSKAAKADPRQQHRADPRGKKPA